MRFVSAHHDGKPLAALVEGDMAIPLVGIDELGSATPTSVLQDPPLDRSAAVPLSGLTLRPVVPHPAKIICVGLNFKAHIAETGRSDSDYPVLFTKFATSLVGPYDPIMLPPESSKVDYEAEMAVVIGTSARRVSRADALAHVAGYTVANDISMRDYQHRTHQWLQGKTWDASNPLGPELVTPDELPSWSDLRLTLTYNGTVLQDATLDLLIFPIDELISTISEFTTLLPGDVILTGTPGGVGARQEPPVFLQPGGVVEVGLSGIGSLRNELRSEA